MATTIDVLTAGGIVRAAEVVKLAAATRLDVAAAAVVLVKESSGGHNVWGRDGVSTGGAYTKGGPVTEANYRAYSALVRAGKIGRNGVGPCQLTHSSLQDRADARGGCWDWRTNVLVGFDHLSGLIEAYGERDGFRRYNGSGPAAEAYADDAMRKLKDWRTRLAAVVQPVGGGRATIRRGSTGPDVELIQRFLGVVRAGEPGYGTFGPATDAAVRRYQQMRGVTVDGVVGPATWRETGL